MKKFLILVLVILEAEFVLAIDNNPLKANTTNQIEIQPEKGIEDQPLEKLLEDLKKRSIEKNIEIYYLEKTIKETIIQEAPKEEYLEHLLQALKDSLKKGKKTGKIRRVEKNLIEIDKGAVHKVRERDIYKVYDSTTGAYKGKIEIQAIADAISIGKNYNLKGSSLNVNDTVEFLGQRKYIEIGISIGGYEEIAGVGGLVWRYNVFGGWGFELIGGGVNYSKNLENNITLRYRFGDFLIGARKYFNFPSLYCPYIGVGIVPKGYVIVYDRSRGNIVDNIPINQLTPYFSLGLQLFSCRTLHIDVGIHYLFVPEVNIGSELIQVYPVAVSSSFCMSW